MKILDANKSGLTIIGRQGENSRTILRFPDSAEVFEEYPEATVQVLHQRFGDPAAYPVYDENIGTDEGVVYWQIGSGDTANVGRGQCELVFAEGDVIVKTMIYGTQVLPSLSAGEEPPEPWESWTGEISRSRDAAAESAEAAETAMRNASREATNAGVSALVAEGWAKGTQGGTPVESGSEYYENNAKYYAEQTETAKTTAVQAIEDKGEQVLQSIPADYTELSGDVEDLKSAINANPGLKESTKTGVDLDVSDSSGNVIARFQNGHVKTKNFDSSSLSASFDAKVSVAQGAANAGKAMIVGVDGNLAPAEIPAQVEIDATLTQTGEAADAKAVGDEISNVKSKTAELKGSTATADMDISDENGNVLARFKEGQIRTSEFNSAFIRQLTGKRWTVIGDSLTEANLRTTKNYHDYIHDETGITVTNLGRSGRGYAKVANGMNFSGVYASIPADTDVITIFGSGNDMSAGLSLGTATDTGTTTLCGCINATIDSIYNAFPTTPFGIITPTPWDGSEPSDGTTAMSSYCAAICEICNLRGIPCLDLYHCSNLHPSDSNFLPLAYSKDEGNGVHPDETGHAIIAPRIRQFLFSLI